MRPLQLHAVTPYRPTQAPTRPFQKICIAEGSNATGARSCGQNYTACVAPSGEYIDDFELQTSYLEPCHAYRH